jgi:hypothetical protein
MWRNEELLALPPGSLLLAAERQHDVYLPQAGRFDLLDSVFTAFAQTNVSRGRHYSFEEILNIKKETPTGFRFIYHDIPYHADVFLYDNWDVDWINIKLVNDGFTYVPKRGHCVPPRPPIDGKLSDGWIALKSGVDGVRLPGIYGSFKDINGGAYTGSRLFYNFKHRRLDFKIVSSKTKHPHVLITFEDGTPDFDEEVESCPLSDIQ